MAVADHRARRPIPAGAARALAEWAATLAPSNGDLALADRALRDTVAVAVKARSHELRPLFDDHLGDAGRLAALAHVLDFDDLHMPSTTHISAVCVPVALTTGGGASAYLAGAGVMARLGTALGWTHYNAGWHATCTAGAPAAAAAAAVAQGLATEQIGTAIALAIPAAGGVQKAFGTAAKALQVGFAADAGTRAAKLAQAGATADHRAVDDWIALVGGTPLTTADPTTPAVPGGLAIKLFPCCYALQRPISAVRQISERPPAHEIDRITITTPASSTTPLIHASPTTGLEGKFSLEYGIAAALLDGHPNIDSFTDAAVGRPEAGRLMNLIDTHTTDAGERGLLAAEIKIEIATTDGRSAATSLATPPGAPDRPPTDTELSEKIGADLNALTWESAAEALRRRL
jgi:2-methylcitrate dehydratase PrpD